MSALESIHITALPGVRRPGAALVSIKHDRGESGARPPHSREARKWI